MPDETVTWFLKQTGKTCWRLMSRERWVSQADAQAALDAYLQARGVTAATPGGDLGNVPDGES